MAIEPSRIMSLIRSINVDTPIEHFMEQIYLQLPTCIQRAIATLQCTQLETGYREEVARVQQLLGFDLHQSIRSQIEKILTRKR